jgi:transcriptional regulator with XRE-family HTH domain
MPAKPLTSEQLADANRLKAIFLQWQAGRKERDEPASQLDVVDMLGFNQSAMSQYLNGRIPLNVEAAAKFARMLGCSIADFSPSLAALAVEIGRVASCQEENGPGVSDAEERELLLLYRSIEKIDRHIVVDVMRSLATRLGAREPSRKNM